MKNPTPRQTESGPVQKIETIFGDVYVYEFHPAMDGVYESPYLVIDVDTWPGADRRIVIHVDDETVYSGDLPWSVAR